MILFLLSIWFAVREISDVVDSIRRLSLSIHWQFQGVQLLCFRQRLMGPSWHNVFHNSMSLPWLYFCYWFDASFMNSLTLSISYVGCHSVFIDDFKVYSDSIFADDLWICRDITLLTIPCVSHDSIFAIDLCISCEFIDAIDYIRRLSLSIHWRFRGLSWLCFRWQFMDQPWHSVFDNSMSLTWLYFCYWFDASFVNSLTLSIRYVGCHAVFMDDFKDHSDSVFAADLWITREITFLTIPCFSHDSIFAIELMSRSWIH